MYRTWHTFPHLTVTLFACLRIILRRSAQPYSHLFFVDQPYLLLDLAHRTSSFHSPFRHHSPSVGRQCMYSMLSSSAQNRLNFPRPISAKSIKISNRRISTSAACPLLLSCVSITQLLLLGSFPDTHWVPMLKTHISVRCLDTCSR